MSAIPTFFVENDYLAEKLIAEFDLTGFCDELDNITKNHVSLNIYSEIRNRIRDGLIDCVAFKRFLTSTCNNCGLSVQEMYDEESLPAFVVAIHYFFGY